MISPHYSFTCTNSAYSQREATNQTGKIGCPRKASHGCFGAVKSCTHMYTSVYQDSHRSPSRSVFVELQVCLCASSSLQRYPAEVTDLISEGEIGSGTCGQVFKVRFRKTCHIIAVKVRNLLFIVFSNTATGPG